MKLMAVEMTHQTMTMETLSHFILFEVVQGTGTVWLQLSARSAGIPRPLRSRLPVTGNDVCKEHIKAH